MPRYRSKSKPESKCESRGKIRQSNELRPAFTSGFLAGIIHKNDFKHALELGMANAASVLQYYGTKNNLLTYNQAIRFIKTHKGGFTEKKC